MLDWPFAGQEGGIPIIGDNVCMNANSMVVGGCHIGNNVLIAPGAFVNFDVPDNSIVIGNPAKGNRNGGVSYTQVYCLSFGIAAVELCHAITIWHNQRYGYK